MCATCLDAEESNYEPKPHVCPRNYSSSSKAMELDAALEVYMNLYEQTNGTVAIGHVVADDDSSMRSYLRHRSPLYLKGNLP